MKAVSLPESACCPPPDEQEDLRPVEGREADDELAAYAKALGHPARVRIMRILTRRTTCICGDIVEELDLAQSTVSQHLKILLDARLVTVQASGTKRIYAPDDMGFMRLNIWLDQFWKG